MKWLWITALLFLVTGVKSGPTKKDGDIVLRKITKIERTAMGDATSTPPDTFKFTISETTNGVIVHLILVVSAKGEKETPVEAKDISSPSFEVDLSNYFGKKATFLILETDAGGLNISAAQAYLTPFPSFPTTDASTSLEDPRNPPDRTIIRLEGSLGSMLLNNVDPLVTREQLSYFSFSSTEGTDYIPCNNDGGVPVCDAKLNNTAPGTNHDQILSSAVLSYSSDSKATIKLTPKSDSIEILEAILMPETSQGNDLCADIHVPDNKCIIDWTHQSSNILNMIIIQKTSDSGPSEPVPWATNSVVIRDRELVATQLGADIIEGRWLMLEGEYPGEPTIQSIYRLRKNSTGPDPWEYEDTEVDCSHLSLELKLCFGYFPHLVQGKTYTLTVAYKGSDKANEMDQIESSPVPIIALEPELEILSRHTTTHRNQQKADVQICFQHLTPTEGRSFSHYEMLIINEKGQWLKHRIMQEEEEEEEEGDASEERLCFAPFTISTKDFDLTEGTKVVVSQRAVDEVSVLASGESALF